MTRLGQPKTQRARLAIRTKQIVETTRSARFALQRASEQVLVRTKEVTTVDDAGNAIIGRVPLSEEERIERLQSAASWLHKAEDEMHRLRGFIDRTLEDEWKHL